MDLTSFIPEQKLRHIRAQNRARANKYYETHKEQITQKANARRAKVKAILDVESIHHSPHKKVRVLNGSPANMRQLLQAFAFNSQGSRAAYIASLNRIVEILGVYRHECRTQR